MSVPSQTPNRHAWWLKPLVPALIGLSVAPALAVDIQPTYDPNITDAQKTVIEKKIQLWEGRLPHQDPEHVVAITFANGDLGSMFFVMPPGVEPMRADTGVRGVEGLELAATSGFTNDADGRPTGATITINNNAAVSWYEGLDPAVPATQYDLYTVMNHELMHALGFTVSNPRFARNVTLVSDPNDPNTPPDPNTAARTYNGGGPENTPTGTLTPRDQGTHTDPGAHPDDLMNPELPTGTRRTPSQTDIDILLDDVWRYPNIAGSLSNFDVWNRSGLIANDFMVTLGGVIPESIGDIYNGGLCPFPNGHTEPATDGTVVKWGPGPGQVNPGDKGHFGFTIAGGLTPLSYLFQWTQNGVVISTVPVNGTTWRTLYGPRMAWPVRNRITNNSPVTVWVLRRVNYSPVPIVLDDLLVGMPLEVSAIPVDPSPVPVPPYASITYDYVGVPDGAWGVVMIADYFEDLGGVPGLPLGTWLDAAALPQPFLTGDMNCDGIVDFGDINPFVQFLSDPLGWQMAFPGCPMQNGDINGDGLYPDFADINPFVALLTGP
jgi:hypothetical protein